MMRAIIQAAIFGTCLALPTAPALAIYPERSVQLIVPYAAGGAGDVMARVFSKELETRLHQPFVVVNRPGGGTTVGAVATAAAAPDGYTILLSSNSTYTLNPAVNPKVSYDPVTQFEPIARVGGLTLTLLTQADSPLDSVGKVVEAAKADPKKLFYASFGNGTVAHFAGEMFKSTAGIEMTHVPYRGSAPAMTDLLAGQVPLSFDTVVAAQPHLAAGKIKVLAVTTAKRSALMPDVPTFAELGYKDYEISSWIAFVGPKGLAAEAKSKLREAIKAIMSDPGVRERLVTLGFDPDYAPLDDWTDYVSKDLAKMREIATKAQMRPE
jgi:tripartite-type tricarboxylate transporter receptor subunit TctC